MSKNWCWRSGTRTSDRGCSCWWVSEKCKNCTSAAWIRHLPVRICKIDSRTLRLHREQLPERADPILDHQEVLAVLADLLVVLLGGVERVYLRDDVQTRKFAIYREESRFVDDVLELRQYFLEIWNVVYIDITSLSPPTDAARYALELVTSMARTEWETDYGARRGYAYVEFRESHMDCISNNKHAPFTLKNCNFRRQPDDTNSPTRKT